MREIKHYQIKENLGNGGMGVVYKAFDTLLERNVAIKIMHRHMLDNSKNDARFLREARAAAKLIHPNVVTIHEIGEAECGRYIVMEYIHGPTLKDVIRERAPLSVEFSLKIAEEVCTALEYAHRQGVIHRDIKPQNILLRKEDDVVKVADFGIARSRLDPESTAERLAMGTVKYVSPVFHLVTGYTLIGAFFLATEDSSSPVNFIPMLIYGAAGGIMTVLIRNVGVYVDGVIMAVLVINLIHPILDKIRPKALGKVE